MSLHGQLLQLVMEQQSSPPSSSSHHQGRLKGATALCGTLQVHGDHWAPARNTWEPLTPQNFPSVLYPLRAEGWDCPWSNHHGQLLLCAHPRSWHVEART